MTINIEKKKIIIICSVLLLVVFGYIGFSLYDNYKYKKNAETFKEHAYKLFLITSNVCSQINTIWQDYIFDDKEYFSPVTGNSSSFGYSSGDIDEQKVYCTSFSEIIIQEEKFLQKKGIITLIENHQKKMKDAFENMTPPPSKYKKEHETLIKMYNAANSLYHSAINPSGNLQSYTVSISENSNNFIEAIEQSEIEICPINKLRGEFQLDIITAIEKCLKSEDIESEENVKNRNKSKTFIKNKAKEGNVSKLPGGTLYKVLTQGNGSVPKSDAKVLVIYEGKTIDGSVFDSSEKNNGGKPSEIVLDQVIPAWQQALTHMAEGSEWELYVPYNQAYGNRDMGEIKPYSALIFKIRLVKVL